MKPAWIAVDIGAESGRVVRGELSDHHLVTEEVHRFKNTPRRNRWDLELLSSETLSGVRQALPAMSVGVDTWGVDFVRMNRHGAVENPRQYRDPRNPGAMEAYLRRFSRSGIYDHTGVQFLPFNTLFQFEAQGWLECRQVLLMPDYLHWVLTDGRAWGIERTNAITTQMVDARAGDWWLGADPFGWRGALPQIIEPGTKIGRFEDLDVIAPCTHDTASAIVAVPITNKKSAWISSGTWSILGIEIPEPVISERSFALNFTNEGGYGCTRLCKNCSGMWLIQQCRRAWKAGSYAELTAQAAAATTPASHFDPDHADFLADSPDMPERIAGVITSLGLVAPTTHASLIRLILESLALKYRHILGELRELSPTPIEQIHVVGGGSQNVLLNQLTADITGLPVIAGPVEATAIGNLLVQMIATGHVANLDEGRALVARSFPTTTFSPKPDRDWDKLYSDFVARNQL